MSDEPVLGENLAQKQQSQLIFAFEEDADLWLVLLDQFIESHGTKSEVLKEGLLNNTAEWKATVNRVKASKFTELKALATEKIAQWNVWICQLLADAGHANILRFYLKSLINLKTQRVADVGIRAQARKQINTVIAAMANDAFSTLDKYTEATARVTTHKTLSGKPLTPDVLAFYESYQAENLKHLSALIAIILIFKKASCRDDIERLQKFIRTQVIQPLEIKTATLKEEEDIKRLKGRAHVYEKLYMAVDISFD